jgi:uncharacterized protein (TIGR00251 family)
VTDALIDVRVIPRAARAGIAGTRAGALLVRLNSPPVEGAANDELIDVLSKALRVARSAITIVSGARSRSKKVRITGMTPEQARALLHL